MATNRIDSLDPALIRPGRIDRKIEFPLPDEKTRRMIFKIHTGRMTLAADVNLEELIMAKDDLSGADIKVGSSFSNLRHCHRRFPRRSALNQVWWPCVNVVWKWPMKIFARVKKQYSIARTKAHQKGCIYKHSIRRPRKHFSSREKRTSSFCSFLLLSFLWALSSSFESVLFFFLLFSFLETTINNI